MRARLKKISAIVSSELFSDAVWLSQRSSACCDRNHTYRFYVEEALQVRSKNRKKLTRPRQPLEVHAANSTKSITRLPQLV